MLFSYIYNPFSYCSFIIRFVFCSMCIEEIQESYPHKSSEEVDCMMRLNFQGWLKVRVNTIHRCDMFPRFAFEF